MIIAEVLFDLGMSISVHVGSPCYLIRILRFSNLDCTMVIHRRCINKVGNYCGCEENVLALYDKWKETVGVTIA